MNEEDIQGSVEALLFSSGRAMSEEALTSVLDVDPKLIRSALEKIKALYDERETALKVFEENHSWKLLVKDRFIEVVRRVVADTELSRPTLETLAVIAFHYPKILQATVIHKRGSGAYDHIKELEHAGFLQRTPEGRSFAIKLTEKFFEYFDVEGAEDIREVFKDVAVPEPPKKVGELDVVDVPEQPENPFMERELGTKPEISPEEAQEQQKWLGEIEEKIDDVSSRNDENDEDETFKPMVDDDSEETGEDDSENNEESEEDEPFAPPSQVVDEYEETPKKDSESDSEDGESDEKKSALDEPLDVENL